MVAKKYFLVTVLMMTANIFIVNDVRAADENGQGTKGFNPFSTDLLSACGCFLYYENEINLVGGELFHLSILNYNHENKPNFLSSEDWFIGWDTKPFLKGYLQFYPNINFSRGLFWLFMALPWLIIGGETSNHKEANNEGGNPHNNISKKDKQIFLLGSPYTASILTYRINFGLLRILSILAIHIIQGFISIPCIIHFTPTFSISIAFDSIIWIGLNFFLGGKGKNDWKEASETKD